MIMIMISSVCCPSRTLRYATRDRPMKAQQKTGSREAPKESSVLRVALLVVGPRISLRGQGK